ncbi:MAG: ATP-binding protein [Gemmatimonadales bacterium]
MSRVVLNLMETAAVVHSPGSPAATLRTSKSLALLSYLTLEPGAHSRDELATLLWSESSDTAAHASLRQALTQLRGLLGDGLRADRDRVEITGDVACDVRDFLVACDGTPAAAAAFDVAHFMNGITVPRAPVYEEWVDNTRTMLLRRHVQALRSAVHDAMAASRWREAAMLGARWLEDEPLSEEAVRLVAESELMAGDQAAALARVRAYIAGARANHAPQPGAALIALKQRLEAEPARRPRDPRAAGHTHPEFSPSLIGRERQWRVLTDVWRDVSEGRGRIVLLEGEVGMGKTRLAEDWLRWIRAQGGTVLRGRAHDAETAVPYGSMVAALRCARDAPGIGGTAPAYLAEVARVLPELHQTYRELPTPGEATDTAERSRLFEAVAQLLLALADEAPVVLLIDDLQWCDSETCALVHFLMQRLVTASVAVVLTVRLGDLDREAPAARLFRALRAPAGASIIPVTPLTGAEVLQLVCESGAPGPDKRVRRLAAGLHHATEGNPLHVVELLKMLVAGNALGLDVDSGEWFAWDNGETDDDGGVPVPQAVRDVIAARVARIPGEMRDFVATTAVRGRPCHSALLAQVHGVSRLRASALCDELVERLLMREDDGGYTCAHPVIGHVVRATLTKSRRAETHRAIAMALEAITPDSEVGNVAAEIARHAERGHEPAMTYYYALLASENAMRRAAPAEARSWLVVAAKFAEPGEQMDEVERQRAGGD